MAALAFQLAGMGAGLLGNLFGGNARQKALSRATDAQIAANQAAEEQWRYGLGRGNQFISDAAQNATTWAGDAANYAAGIYTDAAQRAKAGMDTAVSSANTYLDPYVQAGPGALTRLSAMADEGPFQFTQDDPSYQWRLQQGQKALMNTQAGRSLSGAAATAMQRYAQGAASTEYQAAFDRWAKTRGMQSSILSGLVDVGGRAASQVGSNLIGGARYGGDITAQAAKYAGDVGIDASQFGGRAQMWGAGLMNQNQMDTARALSGLESQAGDIRAAGYLGQGNLKAGMWSSLGNFGMSAGSAISDYYRSRPGGSGAPTSTPYSWSSPWGRSAIPGVDDWQLPRNTPYGTRGTFGG